MMTAQCVTRDQLQEYLSGWTAPEQSETIEAHLLECPVCEQAVAELEGGGSDVFLESLRRSQTQPHELETPSAEVELAAALERAKHLGEVAEASENARQMQPEWPVAPADVGSYELLRPLGHGGMGSVYLARHRQLGKQLAIKLLSARLNRNGGYTARFQREMRAAGGLDHPAIVRATDAGEHNGTHYLAMEYIEGLDLSRIARLLGKFSIADGCEIARQVALGLSHAHAGGVTHRDIKPSNIMLSTSGQVKILDFGLARLKLWDEVSAELTTVGQLIGTLDYMAPEQADRPESVDYRADLYALGATLFRLLCGRAPLAASPEMSPLAKLRLLATQPPPSLATLRPDAPEPLVRLLSSLLARDPESRPASAAHVAEELATFARGSDLPALIARAQAHAHAQPEEATAELASSALPSMQSFHGPALELAAGAAKPPRRTERLVAWAFAPLALLAGVLITLETQKGNLVIESEAANVTVKLLRDGKPYEQLKVEPGATSTRLYAGQYEVTLDGGSDSLMVDQELIEVRRGETVVARIRQQSAQAAGAAPKEPAAGLRLASDQAAEIAKLKQQLAELQATVTESNEEPLYDGKPLAYWLDKIGRERSNAGYREALTALEAMLAEGQAHKISSTLLTVLHSQPAARSEGGNNLDRVAFSIIRSANPGPAYYALLAKELESGSDTWHRRIFAVLHPEAGDAQTIAPFTEWLEKKVFAKGGRANLLISGADYYQDLIHAAKESEVNSKAKEHFADVLLACEALDDAYWLSTSSPPRPRSSSSPLLTWHPAIGNRIEQIAIRALGDAKSEPKLRAQATVILQRLYSRSYDRRGLQDRRAELVEAIRVSLKEFQASPASLYESQQVDPLFFRRSFRSEPHRISVLPPTLSRMPGQSSSGRIVEYSPVPTVWPGADLVLLVEASSTGSEVVEELVWLFQAASNLSAELFAIVGPNREVSLSWPELRITNPNGVPEQQTIKISPAHWIAAFIHSEAYKLLPQERQAELKIDAVRKHASTSAAELIRKYDTDGDGQLSFEEAKPLGLNAEKVDTNGDNRLSAEELMGFDALEVPAPAEIITANLDWAKRQIEKYDQNSDGQLTSDEWSRMALRPDGADLDGNGAITVEEYAKFRQGKSTAN